MKKTIKLFVGFLILTVIGAAIISPMPAEANLGETFYGVEISRSENAFSTLNVAFPFDTLRFGLSSMWDSAQPTRINIPLSGLWLVGADITTLGTYYGGTENYGVILEIVKNWCGVETTCPHLYADIIGERYGNGSGAFAQMNSTSSIVELQAGDYLELIISGVLLVESNPGDSGTLSPHFYAYYLGAQP